MSLTETYLGIDWGTHSSKWCYQDSSGRTILGPMWDSRVWREGDCLSMFPLESRYEGITGEVGLKRKLIRDPDQNFWEGNRPKLGVTLGEATVFSLCCVLSDAKTALSERNIRLNKEARVTIRFSHPNWMSPENVPALQSFRDAVVLALGMFREIGQESARGNAFVMEISDLKSLVKSCWRFLSSVVPLSSTYEYDAYQRSARGDLENVAWELVFESCAAGFPYLVEAEPRVFEGDSSARADRPYRLDWAGRKILVVDIGAGSTDAGYMLRTVQPNTNQPLLIWLPAASALELGGNWLTDRIHEHRSQAGQPRTTWVEAELYKTQTQGWFSEPFAAEWSDAISNHVGGYMRNVRDEVRLHQQPPLYVVVTGGSSAVDPVRAAIVQKVQSALRQREIRNVQLIDDTAELRPLIATLSSSGFDDARSAQYAVSFGASHPRLVELKHYPEGLS